MESHWDELSTTAKFRYIMLQHYHHNPECQKRKRKKRLLYPQNKLSEKKILYSLTFSLLKALGCLHMSKFFLKYVMNRLSDSFSQFFTQDLQAKVLDRTLAVEESDIDLYLEEEFFFELERVSYLPTIMKRASDQRTYKSFIGDILVIRGKSLLLMPNSEHNALVIANKGFLEKT